MISRAVRRRCAAAALALPLAAAACGSPTGELTNAQALARARSIWAAQGVHSYSFVVTPACYCDTRAFRVTVHNDAVASRVYVDGGGTVPANFWSEIESVPAMFATVQKGIDQHAPTVSAAYDERGVPVQAFIDWSANTADDELGWSVSQFTPAP